MSGCFVSSCDQPTSSQAFKMAHKQSYRITENITATDTWKPYSGVFFPAHTFSLSISSSTHLKARACNRVGFVHMCWCHHCEHEIIPLWFLYEASGVHFFPRRAYFWPGPAHAQDSPLKIMQQRCRFETKEHFKVMQRDSNASSAESRDIEEKRDFHLLHLLPRQEYLQMCAVTQSPRLTITSTRKLFRLQLN